MSIRFENVTKSFLDRKVLSDLSFSTRDGEILYIIGKSGVGKSVTLKHAVGLIKPDSGRIFVGSHEVTSLNREELMPVRRLCGMIFQQTALFDSMNIFDNIAYGLRSTGLDSDALAARVSEVLSLVQLDSGVLDKLPCDLSFGMQKRVSLARTIAPSPAYLLFDEPTTGLDPIITNAIGSLITGLSRQLGTTSIVVSHDMESALSTADRIMLLDNGGIAALGTPGEIRQSTNRLVMEFLAEINDTPEAGTSRTPCIWRQDEQSYREYRRAIHHDDPLDIEEVDK